MRGAIPPLAQYAFMAWCSVKDKAQGQLYLYFTLGVFKSFRTESIKKSTTTTTTIIIINTH
jgi:hypothetical protein